MTPATPKRSREEVAKLGQEIFERRVRPNLKPEDVGKYVAIDIATEEYEVDLDDYAAVMRLRGRNPGAEVWLMRASYPAAYSLLRVEEYDDSPWSREELDALAWEAIERLEQEEADNSGPLPEKP